MIITHFFSKHNDKVLLAKNFYLCSLLIFLGIPGFGQQPKAQLIEIERVDISKWRIPVDDSNEKKVFYKALITDELGEDFQTEEDLHVRIGTAKELKYNINQGKKTATLGFSTSETGCFTYKIYGRFRHVDGYWYEVSGSGSIEILGGEHFRLYLLSLNKSTKTAIAFIQ